MNICSAKIVSIVLIVLFLVVTKRKIYVVMIQLRLIAFTIVQLLMPRMSSRLLKSVISMVVVWCKCFSQLFCME